MMEPLAWMAGLDWRGAAGLFCSIQLIIWNGSERRRRWLGRAAAGVFALCAFSRLAGALLERSGVPAVAGHAAYILGMGLLFAGCYTLCYRASAKETAVHCYMAVTVYQAAWSVLTLLPPLPGAVQPLTACGLYLLASAGSRWLYRRLLESEAAFRRMMFLLILCVTLLCAAMPELAAQDSGPEGAPALMALLLCVVNFFLLVLTVRLARKKEDQLTLENLLRSKRRYDEISRESVAALQVKCHDLKHQLAQARSPEGQRQMEQYLDSLARSIEQYGSVVDCGNQAVDAVLTEKKLLCAGSGIRFTYMLDGTLFDPLSEMEIYALFGNVMDNALEGMEETAHPERRYISLKAARRGELVILTAENYTERRPEFRNGLPVTTKREAARHGFGLRSIREIARKHGGEISVRTEEQAFRLTVTMRLEASGE